MDPKFDKNGFYHLIAILFIVSTIFSILFWTLIGGNPLYRLNDTVNLSNFFR